MQLLALRALVEKLRRRKYAATERPAKPRVNEAAEQSEDFDAGALTSNFSPNELADNAAPELHGETTAPARRSPDPADETTALARKGLTVRLGATPTDLEGWALFDVPSERSAASDGAADAPSSAPSPAPRRSQSHSMSRSSSRAHLPAAVRREVWRRDGGRCTYVDARGKRCPSTRGLEFHHEQATPWGEPTVWATCGYVAEPTIDWRRRSTSGRSTLRRSVLRARD